MKRPPPIAGVGGFMRFGLNFWVVLISVFGLFACNSRTNTETVDAGMTDDMGETDTGTVEEDMPMMSMGGVGDACTTSADCGENAACIVGVDSSGNDTGFVGGYCIATPAMCGDGACAENQQCFNLNLGGDSPTPACIKSCADDSECRPGYVCDGDNTCWPGCDETHPCPSPFACSASGLCETPYAPPACSATHPSGYCDGTDLCLSGACTTPPACGTDSNEPNETKEAATPLTLGTPVLAGRCSGDTDWFRIDVPAGQIVQVLATFPAPSAANLDLYAYRADGTPLGARYPDLDSTPSWARAYETNEEGFGFYTGQTATGTYYVKVTGASTAAEGGYSIVANAIPWMDGASCTSAGFTMAECTGGSRGAQTLIPHPFPDPSDEFVGADYMFDTMSNYRYLRRETLMLVRNALHETMARFPGAHPLGMIDQCQRDAITPGYDVNDPRHPESTHDQGGNIDIAYFQTGADNHARIICDDAEGSEDGSYCLPSAATTHIVDLRREVYFMAMLTRSPRVRVIGVDRVIAPLLEAEARTMQTEGILTVTEMNAVIDHMAYGDGWPFHHHHIHLSMQWL